MLSISNWGSVAKLTTFPPAVLNAFDFDLIMPDKTSYILGLFLSYPLGSLPISSNIFLDLAVSFFNGAVDFFFVVTLGFFFSFLGLGVTTLGFEAPDIALSSASSKAFSANSTFFSNVGLFGSAA